MQSIIKAVQQDIKNNSNVQVKHNYEKYFKYVVNFYGLRGAETKKILQKHWLKIKYLETWEQIKLAQNFLDSKYAEQKQIRIEILLKIHKKLDSKFLQWMQKNIIKNIYDRASCDGLGGKVFGRMIQDNPYDYNNTMLKLSQSKETWLQRISRVSYLRVAKHGQHDDIILNICANTVRNNERFVQLWTGWILRELSLTDLDRVVEFIQNNYNNFSREWLRYAIEKMDHKLRKNLLEYKK